MTQSIRIMENNELSHNILRDVADYLKSLLSAKEKEERVPFKFIPTDGGMRFMGIYSNNFIDRDSETFTEESHLEFAKWVNETGFRPQITVLHHPLLPSKLWTTLYAIFGHDSAKWQEIVNDAYKDFTIGEIDRIIVVNGFAIASGKIFEGKEEIAERLADMDGQGMSHSFILLDEDSGTLKKYRTHEVSLLSRMRAANFFTLPMFKKEVLMKEKRLSDADRQYLQDVYGDDMPDNIEQFTEDAKNRLSEHLSFKELEMTDAVVEGQEVVAQEDVAVEEEVLVEEPATEEVAAPELPEALQDEVISEIEEIKEVQITEDTVKQVAEMLGMEQLAETMKGIVEGFTSEIAVLTDRIASLEKQLSQNEQELKEVKQTEDEKIANTIKPLFDWGSRLKGTAASATAETVVPDEVAKEVIIDTVNDNNPLQRGFWNVMGK